MAGITRLFELWTAREVAFCENAESPNTNTWDERIPTLSYKFTPTAERIPDGGLRSRMNEESYSHPGVRSWTLEIEFYLAGHLTTTAGALTQTWLQKLLSDALGGSNVAAVGTTLSGATTASSFTLTATTGWAAGQIGWMGAKGDGKGDGQAFVVNAVGPPTTSLVALPATPASPDVVYAGMQVYHDESTAQTLTSRRFMCGYSSTPTAGAQFQALGGQLSALQITWAFGDLPRCKATFVGAYWQRNAVTIPSVALTLKDQFCAPTAAGSLCIQDVGTATRNVVTASKLDLQLDIGLEPIPGPGGNGKLQNITGWVRSKCQPTVTVTMPWTTAYETWFDTANSALVSKHMLWNANTWDGRRSAAYFPDMFPIGPRPSFPVDSNNQTYVPVMFRGRDGTVTTNELTRSAFRLALG